MTVSEEIIKVLDDLSNRLGVAIDWSADNVVPYLQDLCGRYVQYEMIRLISITSAFVVLGIIGLILLHKHKYWGVDRYSDGSEVRIGRNLSYGLTIMIIVIPILIIFPDILECIFLPEMVILEELKSFMQ